MTGNYEVCVLSDASDEWEKYVSGFASEDDARYFAEDYLYDAKWKIERTHAVGKV